MTMQDAAITEAVNPAAAEAPEPPVASEEVANCATVAKSPRRKVEDIRKIFRRRMEREGRVKEYEAKIKEIQALTGKGFGQSQFPAMKHLGYQGPKEERELHEAWLQEEERKVEEAKFQTFEEALRELPDKAQTNVELDWIATHPAMARRNRQVDGREIRLTREDVLNPPQGKAPSRAAAIELQNWVNQPKKFFEYMMSVRKKEIGAVESVESAAVTVDPGVDEIMSILKELKRGQQDNSGRLPGSDARAT